MIFFNQFNSTKYFKKLSYEPVGIINTSLVKTCCLMLVGVLTIAFQESYAQKMPPMLQPTPPLNPSYTPPNDIVSVNELTGTANVVIPLYTIAAAHIKFPINLVYSATGVKTSDVEQNAGMGWNVSLGGAVTRQLRGLPDDVSKDGKGNGAFGWLYANDGQTISNLSFGNDNNTSTCSDEANDIGLLYSSFSGAMDTEPDIFQVNAPGLSCQMVFDKNKVLQISPFQDLKVSYVVSPQGNTDQGQITSFTITNDEGVSYVFSATSTVSQTAVASGGSTTMDYFNSNYTYFAGGINYYSSWALTQVYDVHNNSININYSQTPKVSFSNPVQVSIGGGALTTLYTMQGWTTSQLPVSISCSNPVYSAGQTFNINYVGTPSSSKSCISNIIGMGHDFIFGYNTVSSSGIFSRLFLNSIIDETCSAQTVNGQTAAVSSYAPINLSFNYLNTTSTTTTLAVPGALNTDYWGYTNSVNNSSSLPSIDVNPSTPGYERYRNKQIAASPSAVYTYAITGSNREADNSSVAGTLSQINYSAGGYTAFSYEPNDYYDNTLQSVVQGGGIRVTQVLDHDGISTNNDFIKTYSYRNGLSGITTGKAISLPIFAFTIPYSGANTGSALWTSSTIVSPVDLSSEDHSILYGAVTETINNGGYTVYQYALPATNWDTNVPVSPNWSPAGLPVWSPTVVNVGRGQNADSSCPSVGVLKNDVNTYPFPPNTNYDFERGLLTNISKFNNTGTQVSETDYYYQTPEVPIDIVALKYDRLKLDVNTYATNYGTYIIHTSARPVVNQIVNKVFDLTNVSPGAQSTSAQVVTTNNTYNAAEHKLSQQSITNADGSINATNFKYVKDYNISTAGDGYTTNLLALQSSNINMPVETYSQFTPVNSTKPVTTGANLTLFGTFPNQGGMGLTIIQGVKPIVNATGNPGPAPIQYRKFTSTNGVNDFNASSISSTNTFQFDSRYTTIENDFAYDYTGFLLSKDDGYKHIKTTIYDNFNTFRLRADIKDARYDEIGLDYPLSFQVNKFTSFQGSPNSYNFVFSPNSPIMDGTSLSNLTRNGEQALSLPASEILMKSVSKSNTAENYIFSIWVNAASAGTLTVTATDGTNTVTMPLAFDATLGNSKYPNGFEYCRVALPVTGLTASSNITISFSSNQDINCTDIFTYPDVASVKMYTYNTTNQKIAETDGNGVSTYYSYDALGRLLFVYDQDNNIVERKTYVNNNTAINNAPAVNLTWSAPAPGYTINNEIIFFHSAITGYNTCTFNGNTIYTWDFGDGTTQSSNNLTMVGHDYTGNKGQQFTCTLTITSPQNSIAPYSISTVVTL